MLILHFFLFDFLNYIISSFPVEMSAVNEQLSFVLPSGVHMPRIGLGTWVGRDETEWPKAENMVYEAIKIGYRHIDTAVVYQTEKYVGLGIKRAIDEGLVKREELFVVTKVWNDMHDAVVESLEQSLERLGLDYIDLFHVHWPVHWKRGTNEYYESEHPSLLDVWDQMQECHTKGLARHLGVCNYNEEQIKQTWEYASVKPVINQVECSPYWNQLPMQKFLEQYNMHITAYSALLPYGANYRAEWKDIKEDPVLQAIAKKHNKSVPQVALRWQLDIGNSVITKSFRPERLQENFDLLTWNLDKEDLEQIASLKQYRYRNPHAWYLPVKEEYFWPKEESGL